MESKCTVTPYRGFESRPLRHLIVLAGLFLSACNGTSDGDAPAPPDLATLPGVYTGTFPCHDCPGIDTTLWLREDGRFFIRQHYSGDDQREAAEAFGLGRWHWEEGAVLLEGKGPDRVFKKAGTHALLMQTDTGLEHRLTRDAERGEFGAVVRLTGTVGMRADGPVFTECLTGFSLPVKEDGDIGRFRHQLRSIDRRDGPVFAEFEGRFNWSGDGAAHSVTIERFLTIRESGAC